MSTRREFLTAGGALASLSALSTTAAADQQPHGVSIYLHGMVWNRQAAAPMNDWLIRLDAKADIPFGRATPEAVPGFATLGDDFHDGVGAHVDLHSAMLNADHLTLAGIVTESRSGALNGQAIRIEGKVRGTAVDGLTVTIGETTFTGAGLLVVIAIIAILIS